MGQCDQVSGHQAGVIGRLTRTSHAMTAVVGVASDQLDKRWPATALWLSSKP